MTNNIKTQFKVQDLTKMALCVALISISAYITIPLPFTPVGITAQTIIVNLAALILTPMQAALTLICYTLLGIVGVPIFSGGMAGLSRIMGPTGGFILGFILAAFLISLFKGKKISFTRYLIVTVLVGMTSLYICGTLWMVLVGGFELKTAIASAVVPFIFGDILKCIFGVILAIALNKALLHIKK